jgi:hypothetical protein
MTNQDAIERRAYELYEQRGREDGHDWEDWLQAERELAPEVAGDRAHGEPSAAPQARRRRDRREATVTASA